MPILKAIPQNAAAALKAKKPKQQAIVVKRGNLFVDITSL